MARSKQRSAAQRREQTRQQRQQRLNATQQNVQKRERAKKGRKQSQGNSWWLIIGISVMVVVVIGAFLLFRQIQNQQLQAGEAQALKVLTTPDSTVLSTVGAGNTKNTMQAITDTPLKGPTGKPLFLYVGADYCPYCASLRWAIINSLSRFGKFGPIEAIISGESNIPTFTFHNVQYTSQYIDAALYEQGDNTPPPNTRPLDKVPAEYEQIMQKYGQLTGNGIPFVDIANQRISAGSYYQPDVLANRSYEDISAQLKDPNSDIARGIYGSSNLLTAAICEATNNQPANVCKDPVIQQIQQSLPKTTGVAAGNTQLASFTGLPEAIVERRRL
ncbi:MAG: DUF929 family protein [Ktedonobacteraceae bacterium]|nr:DUF929 family protein [Ktedonobacteraceae bacterium]